MNKRCQGQSSAHEWLAWFETHSPGEGVGANLCKVICNHLPLIAPLFAQKGMQNFLTKEGVADSANQSLTAYLTPNLFYTTVAARVSLQ